MVAIRLDLLIGHSRWAQHAETNYPEPNIRHTMLRKVGKSETARNHALHAYIAKGTTPESRFIYYKFRAFYYASRIERPRVVLRATYTIFTAHQHIYFEIHHIHFNPFNVKLINHQ